MSGIKKVDQVSAQFNVVQTLAETIQTIANELQATLREDVPEHVLDSFGNRSASLMESLGDILNGMDAVTNEDNWMQPVFERAHALYPQERARVMPEGHIATNEIWLIGKPIRDGDRELGWMAEGAFASEEHAAAAAKDDEFIALVTVGELFPNEAVNARKLYWPRRETWEQSSLYRMRTDTRRQMAAITGGMDLDLYIAKIQTDAISELQAIRKGIDDLPSIPT